MEEQTAKQKEINVPGYMILKKNCAELLLRSYYNSPKYYALSLGIPITEAYKLLSGERVNSHTAIKFLNRYKAHIARWLIDWAAMGMEDPYPNIWRMMIEEETEKKLLREAAKDKKAS